MEKLASALDLAGKRALVTGGSRGIGAAICKVLARSGADVFVNYRADEKGAQEVIGQIQSSGGSAAAAPANLVHPSEIRGMFETVLASGPLDILVHNAAIGSFKPTLEVRPNQWDLSLSVNARAFLVCAQEAAAGMPSGGRIIALSSLGGGRAIPFYGAIGASKAALESLTRSLAVELGPRRITVNAVSAGLVDTESIRSHPGYAGLERAALARTPLGRLGTTDDVAAVVLFLCSPLSEWITGQVLVADGGLSVTF